ncbi:MAG TPA: DUF3987 domain-containing protein [Polyangiaceae bacterium]|nr:DUF3987 domain-containing protein [Polyangiaceae bacterium]
MTVTFFRAAWDAAPQHQIHGDWDQFVEGLREGVQRTVPAPQDNSDRAWQRAKRNLPGIVCAPFGGSRSDDTVGAHTAIVIDVDDVPDESALIAKLERWRCVAYESPSSGCRGKGLRLRVAVALTEPVPPHAVEAARSAFACELGLDPDVSGVSKADAASQIMFIGRIDGTSERQVWTFDGAPWAPPEPGEAPPKRERTSVASSEPLYGVDFIPDLSVLAREIGTLDDRGMRQGGVDVMRATGGMLAKRGYHPDAIYDAVYDQLPSDQPDERARLAQETAEQFYRGANTVGRTVLAERFGEDVAEELEAALVDPWIAMMLDKWPSLKRRKSMPVLDALTPWVRDFVVAQQEEMRTPLALNIGVAIGTVAACVNGHVRVKLGANWTSEAGLYVCCVAPTGQTKSPVLKMSTEPIKAWVAEQQDAERESLEKKLMHRAALDARRKALENEMKGGWGSVKEAPDSPELLEIRVALTAPAPVPFEMLIADATPEVVVDLLAKHGRLACITGEASKVFNMLSSGSKGEGKADLSAWLDAYDGTIDKVHRMGRKAEEPRHAHTTLSALLMTQPIVVQRVANDPVMCGEGFVPRLAWITCANDGPRWAEGEQPSPVPDTVLEAWRAGVRKVLGIEINTSLELSADAQRAATAFRDELEQRIQDDRDLGGSMRGWTEKHRERVARIAAGLWATDGAEGKAITGEQYERAVVIGRWLIDHAKAVIVSGRAQAQRDALDQRVLALLDGRSDTKRGLASSLSPRQREGLAESLERLLSVGQVVFEGDRYRLR